MRPIGINWKAVKSKKCQMCLSVFVSALLFPIMLDEIPVVLAVPLWFATTLSSWIFFQAVIEAKNPDDSESASQTNRENSSIEM